MQKWEHMTKRKDSIDQNKWLDRELNLYVNWFILAGLNGWELVAVDENMAYFKRPIKPSKEAEKDDV